MLAVENLSVYYGAIRALHQVSCRVEQGEIVALIGANGAGKTTILNTISGIVPSIGGSVSFEGQEITLFPRLAERRKQAARTLSGGEQQMLAMGRALMSNPRLLLLDEPSMGLAPMLVEKIFEIVVEINKTGTTIMLVEQNASMALSIAHRAYVLETGEVVLSGDAGELARNPEVRKAYLGE